MKEKTPRSMHRQDLKKMMEENFPQIRKEKPVQTQEAQILHIERIWKKVSHDILLLEH